jgi:hypothetical protein
LCFYRWRRTARTSIANSVGHETKSFERCKAILMSRVFGAFRVSSEYFANVSEFFFLPVVVERSPVGKLEPRRYK